MEWSDPRSFGEHKNKGFIFPHLTHLSLKLVVEVSSHFRELGSAVKMRLFESRNKNAPLADIAVGEPATEVDVDNKQPTATDDSSIDEVPDKNVEDGVRKAQAVTLSWTKKELILAYAW